MILLTILINDEFISISFRLFLAELVYVLDCWSDKTKISEVHFDSGKHP